MSGGERGCISGGERGLVRITTSGRPFTTARAIVRRAWRMRMQHQLGLLIQQRRPMREATMQRCGGLGALDLADGLGALDLADSTKPQQAVQHAVKAVGRIAG